MPSVSSHTLTGDTKQHIQYLTGVNEALCNIVLTVRLSSVLPPLSISCYLPNEQRRVHHTRYISGQSL